METNVTTGDLRIQSFFCPVPGRQDWPLLGCIYRSTDGMGGAFGAGRSAGSLLGMRVLGPDNSGNVNVVTEQGLLDYFLYADGQYQPVSSSRGRREPVFDGIGGLAGGAAQRVLLRV